MKISKKDFLFLLILFISYSFNANFQDLSQKKIISSNLLSVSFSDTLYGWIVGSNNTALRTTNGGISWDSVFLETGPYASYPDLRCVASPDPNTVWITNWSGDGYTNLMRSIDGGDTWSKVLSTFTGHIGATFLDKVSAIDSMKAWVVGYDGLDFTSPPNEKTTDGGKTWQQFDFCSICYPSINDVEFLSDSVVMILADYPILYRSLNGGASWYIDTLIKNANIYQSYYLDMSAIDSSHIWLAGYSGTIIKTTNGGMSWITLNSESTDTLNAIQAIDSLNIWTVGNNGIILHSSDGGNSWDSFATLMKMNLHGLCFTDINHGWIVGDCGVIIQYKNGLLTSTQSIPASLPNSFELYQNYPNPFNPSTTIIYSISKGSNVIIRIYNNLGQEVRTLTNEYKMLGRYILNFDATNLAGGVYFYQLNANGFTITKKMILLH